MIDFDLILAGALACAPSIATVISTITSYRKMTKQNTEIKTEVLNTKEYKSVKTELALAHQENRELKKLIKELLTKIDKIERKGEE